MMSLAVLARRIAAFLTLIAIIYLLLQEDQREPAPTFIGSGVQRPYAILDGGTIRQYDEQGRAAATLYMDSASYYNESDAVDLTNPRMELDQSASGKVSVTAQQGRYHPSAQQLELQGDVLVKQQDGKSAPLLITTETLQLDNQRRFISTDSAVTIRQGAQRLEAIGMRANLDNRKVELLSQVKGRYVLDAQE